MTGTQQGFDFDGRHVPKPIKQGRVVYDGRDFAGATYVKRFDRDRLNGQQRRVRDAMIDGRWRTLSEIAAVTGDPEASISARLRALRKPEFGAYTMTGRRRGDGKRGLWEYRVIGGMQ